jgi:hypothetical protein
MVEDMNRVSSEYRFRSIDIQGAKSAQWSGPEILGENQSGFHIGGTS